MHHCGYIDNVGEDGCEAEATVPVEVYDEHMDPADLRHGFVAVFVCEHHAIHGDHTIRKEDD